MKQFLCSRSVLNIISCNFAINNIDNFTHETRSEKPKYAKIYHLNNIKKCIVYLYLCMYAAVASDRQSKGATTFHYDAHP